MGGMVGILLRTHRSVFEVKGGGWKNKQAGFSRRQCGERVGSPRECCFVLVLVLSLAAIHAMQRCSAYPYGSAALLMASGLRCRVQ